VVGTSADYPPFEYVDEKGQFVGFDMDLIRAVGDRMGVKVEIVDMSFDALIASLKEGKIDAVIACMSSTPERAKEVDFTDPYYNTLDGVLIASSGGPVVKTLEDVYDLRIGVQTGTTQDEWVTEKIVEGVVRESKVFRYPRQDQAVLDLVNGRLDVVLMDLPPAKKFAQVRPVSLALEVSISGGDPAVAIRKGETDLRDEIDKIIKQLTKEGILDALVDKHLALMD